MTNEPRTAQKKELEHLLHNCPEVVLPSVAAKWMPFGKNRVYELIHTGELRAFNYRAECGEISDCTVYSAGGLAVTAVGWKKKKD